MTAPTIPKSDILLYLADNAIADDGYNGAYALTVPGLAEAFGVGERYIVEHLRLMVKEGTIRIVPLHVHGLPRNRPIAARTRCYFLTGSGWEVVRGCVYEDRVQQPGQVPVR